jgi:hypothetical protein
VTQPPSGQPPRSVARALTIPGALIVVGVALLFTTTITVLGGLVGALVILAGLGGLVRVLATRPRGRRPPIDTTMTALRTGLPPAQRSREVREADAAERAARRRAAAGGDDR